MTDMARIMLIIFIGTHIPLISVAATVLLFQVDAMRAVLIVLVLGTLAGAVVTMLAVARMIRARDALTG